ncbi:DMT family transporter [Sinorhizobium alkalisoli]|uniref:Multidrug DMT transporter permease n=1 Tax=Sinorhizobium alkalisoli TaxID=1752398 RepID=A0A1E3V903_9HYPH|nr:DMT family transporter [Sinorhizobium alkalisoli]MCA1490270.1 DMT family transporter [Ensifer sp. NBAIM29]MCG5478581.1 DMT family transporter [Sinorhizobium alkalisoli]ODR90118.1 multidrug DMT transporter permease [Sinorhizobium alkalisoli]
MDRDTRRGSVEMTAAMLISGTIGWFVLMSGQPVAGVVFWRCVFGTATLAGLAVAFGLVDLRYLRLRVIALSVAGGVAIVVNWLLLFAAYPRASISIATMVYNTQPFMLLGLGALFLGERITAMKLFWLSVSFAGMMAIVSAKPAGYFEPASYLAGIGLALAAAFFYAIAAVVTKLLKGTPPQLIALIQVITGAVMLAPFALANPLPQDAMQWTLLIAIGVVHTGLMYILLYGAIQKLPTHMTGALSFIYPIAAILVDRVAFGHALQPVQFAGSAAILVAAAGTNLGWNFRSIPPIRLVRKRSTS